ncbi:MAG: DUF86 domain-containing protein [Candidatus Azobacteroides sp.]|nr:DUF86 domain-containing protein [Candidatus Azobacteroides sp.]
MDDRIKKHLEDILIAIDEIDVCFKTLPKKYDEFLNNMLLRRAIERNIEIIGEAMNRILKDDGTISITNARKIVDTRNYIIHGYDSLTVDILWSIVVNHLPLLKTEVQELLKS